MQQQHPRESATSSPQASAPPILGGLETGTELPAHFGIGKVIASSEADADERNSGEFQLFPEAPTDYIQGA
jgi:hypothetical protein